MSQNDSEGHTQEAEEEKDPSSLIDQRTQIAFVIQQIPETFHEFDKETQNFLLEEIRKSERKNRIIQLTGQIGNLIISLLTYGASLFAIGAFLYFLSLKDFEITAGMVWAIGGVIAILVAVPFLGRTALTRLLENVLKRDK